MTASITLNLSDDAIEALATAIAAKIGVAEVEAAPEALPEKPKGKKDKGKKDKKGKGKKDAEPEPDDADDDADGDEDDEATAARRAELTALRITSLRKMAKEMGFDADQVAAADKDTLVQSIIDDEAENAGDEDADDADGDDDGDDGDGDDTWTREDFEGMSLKDIKAVAKEAGYTAADIKGLDQDGLVALLLGEGEDYTPDDLKAMDLKELIALAKEWELDLTAAQKKDKKKVIKALLAAQDEE